MPPPTDLLQKADTTACLQFQSTLSLAPRPIEEFLPAEDQPTYLATLCRLITLDLAHRWQQFHQQQRQPQPGATVAYPPGVDAYLARFPKLREAPDAVRLILQEEFRLRHRFGDRPEASEYQARYCEWMDEQTPLETVALESAAPVPARDIPGYTILGELGHGGMGVVYRAQQTSLKRVVALKMIIADRHAAPETRARFRTEAEAVARLHHPNIVQIFDISEHEGCPYFAMEYVAGGSLAKRLRNEPLAPMAAAALLEALARAMHHAHQRGIIHRDLKPANVLLESDEGGAAAATPKITDFGLAKRLDGDSGQTHTGAVMGTPSYMAPEQAAGRIHDVGPLTDVYALGAILYETLTGRPPFHGATSLETMQQVLHDDVPPPSRWRKMSRDIETICLKALAKAPQERYASALELAEDLARFQVGEPIRARREPLLARVARKVRRHRAAVVLIGVILVAAAAVTYFALKDTRGNQAAAAMRDIESAMQEREWPDNRLETLETRLDELAALAPALADELRPKLLPRFAQVLRDSFSPQLHPILQPQELPAIEARIATLVHRDAALGQDVQADLQNRLRKLQEQKIAAPFANLGALIDPALVLVRNDTLEFQPGPDIVSTKVPCLGKIEMDVTFDHSWKNAGRLGLALNHQPDGSEYQFLFGVPDRVDAAGDPLPPLATDSMARHKDASNELSLMIFRNGNKLREQRVSAQALLAAPKLTIHASRDGERLVFQVNQLEPTVYLDSFALAGAAPGVFAFRVPPGIGIRTVRLASQVLPPQPSPLERGNELYTRGQFAEALAEYRRQEMPAVNAELGQELRYKIANCLFRLQRFDEAVPLLEEVTTASGPRWSPLASVHLWIIYLQRNQLNQVDDMLLELSRRYGAEQLATLMPLEIRPHLLRAYTIQSLGAKFVRHDPLRVAKLERVLNLTDMLRVRDYDRLHLRLSLARAYHFAGDFAKAIGLVEAMLKDPSLAGSWPDAPHRLLHWQIRTVEEYGWLMRLKGEPAKALAAIDVRLFKSPGQQRAPYSALLVERARLHAFLKNNKQAEDDLTTYARLADATDHLNYRYYSEGQLLLGFLRHAQGDVAGAKSAWQLGTHQNWLARWRKDNPNEKEDPHLIYAGTQTVTNMVLNSLAGTMTKEDADEIVAQAIQVALDDVSAAAFKNVLRIPPGIFQELWQSPRGLNAARSIAMRDVTWNVYQRLPTTIIGMGVLRQGALPPAPSADQDAVAWKLCEDLQDAYFAEGKIGMNQVFSLGLTWNGNPGILGWARIEKTLPEKLRGPLAFVFGQRYRTRLNNPSESRRFFQTALDDARREPRNAALERLAQAELAMLPEMK